MQAFFHVGAHKTASSYLQNHLRKYRKQLKESGVSVILDSGNFQKVFLKNYWAYLAKATEKKIKIGEGPQYALALEAARDNIKRQVTRDFIFSDERLLGRMLGHTDTLYPSAQYSARFISQIAPSSNPKIIFYLRDQADFIESAYLQYIRETGVDTDFQTFYQDLKKDQLSWKTVVDNFVEVFGEDSIIVKSYESIIGNRQSFLEDFFSIFSSLENLYADEMLVNPRFSGKALEVFTHVHPLLTQNEAYRLQKTLKDVFPKEEYPAPVLLNEEQRNTLKELYIEENQDLLEKYN